MSLKCMNHPDQVTEVACKDCEKGICGKCRVSYGNNYLCIRCLHEAQQKPERDILQENRLFWAGALSVILGVVFMGWGLCVYFGWNPPTRFNTLKHYEAPAFFGFGLLSLLVGMGLCSLSSLGRWLQVGLSVLGILAIMTLHPIVIAGSLVQIYILSILFSPHTGKVFSSDYRQMVTQDELTSNISLLFQSMKLPVIILFGFIGTFLVVVVFVLMFAFEPSFYIPTEVKFIQGDEKFSKDDVIGNRSYHIGFSYEHQKVFPKHLYYQIFLDGQFFARGSFLPRPNEKRGFQQVPGPWNARPGLHEIRVVLFKKKTSLNYQAANFSLKFRVMAPIKRGEKLPKK